MRNFVGQTCVISVCVLSSLVACGGGGGGSSPPPPPKYSVGGSVTGLASGNSITVSNGSDSVTVSVDGNFMMPTMLLDGAAYSVSISPTKPNYEYCTTANGAGAIAKMDVAEVAVTCASPLGTSTATGPLSTFRIGAAYSPLKDGRVLVHGGSTVVFGSGLGSAEIYDPATGVWTATSAPSYAAAPRVQHTATLLPNGKVLIAGGADPTGVWKTAELFDPATGSWSQTGSMNVERYDHRATLLTNGKVLVTGGRNIQGVVQASAELYDPALGTWSLTSPLSAPRYIHTATLLASGKVLVAGGSDSAFNPVATSELYDAATGSWVSGAPMSTARAVHGATVLTNGKVLVSGGGNTVAPSFEISGCEIYDPATGNWSATGSLGTARKNFGATLLLSGKVFVSGGYGHDPSGAALASNELYDPATGSWSTTGPLLTTRWNQVAILLQNGKVLVPGGLADAAFNPLATSEIYW